jgi:tetrathionate reductase subunit B
MDKPNSPATTPEALSRRQLFGQLTGAAVVTAAVAATSKAARAQVGPASQKQPVSQIAVSGRQTGMDFYEFHDQDVFAYTKKDGNLAVEGYAGKRWVMLIDLRKCVGCQACTVACKFENNIPEGSFRTWVPDLEIGTYPETRRAFLPRLCNHCERPSCIEVCPADATWQRRDGIVEIDYDKCWGCGACVNACPYDARFINPVTKTADKCTFCSQRVDQGLLPACVETCIGGARQFGDLSDPKDPVTRQIKSEPVQVLKPGTGNQPRVFYIDLPDQLQTNVPGRPTLWSEMFEDAGFKNPESATAGEWKILGMKEADHG